MGWDVVEEWMAGVCPGCVSMGLGSRHDWSFAGRGGAAQQKLCYLNKRIEKPYFNTCHSNFLDPWGQILTDL